jgi:TolB-like protein/DNA-binding winged helix-turn-helix (wHTH) protein
VSGDFRIADWRVEPGLNIVSHNGTLTRLEPKVMAVLVCLAQHAGKPVTKDELLKTVWPDAFVTEDVLKRAVFELRRVFEDDARESHVIQTIPKSGYRLLAAVEWMDVQQQAPPAQLKLEANEVAAVPRRRSWVLGTVVAVLVALFALAAIFDVGGLRTRLRAKAAPQIRSLAVLPLQNLSGDPAQEYFSDGMTDALITDLAQIGSLKVISRTSSMQYKQTKKSLPDIARELNVDGIVEGTVQRSGDRVRITAQLIHAPADKHLWANSYERDIHDVFALERDLTQEIAREIQAQLDTPNQAQLAQARPVNVKALEAYLQGSYYLSRFTEEDIRKSEEFFQQATDADPAFAPAYVGMALAHYGNFQPSSEDGTIAKRAAERALELDPTLSDAWTTLGKIKLESWDWRGMEEDYRKAIELNPSNALAHEELGDYLDALGRLDEGLKECQIAQQLDPTQDHLSIALDDRQEFDRSIEIKLLMLQNDPNNVVVHFNLYVDYEAKGMYKDAVQHLEQAWALAGFPDVAVNLDRAFTASGYTGAMREYAKQLENLHAAKKIFLPVNLAGVYASLGNKDRAFYWLEEAYQHGRGSGTFLWMLKSYHALGPLHSDPRYASLLRRMGLPP